MQSWEQTLREHFVSPVIDANITLPDAVSAAKTAVTEHLLHSASVRQYLEKLPKGRWTNCPDAPIEELVRYVATQRGEIDKSDPCLNLLFHKSFIMPVFDFEREKVLSAVPALMDSTPAEWELLKGAVEVGQAHDKLWAKWFAEVAATYQSLTADGKSRYEQVFKSKLSAYDYTVYEIDIEKGCGNRRTWAVAFPIEITAICKQLVKMAEISSLESSLSEYFYALRKAYACTNIEMLESRWADVDRAWVEIPTSCRIVPMHGIESGYEHPFCVSPEFRIEIRTDESRGMIEACRKGAIEHAKAFGLSDSLVDLARKRLGHTDIGVFTTAVRSGVNLNFRYAGQAAPNRQDIRSDGGKIFIDKEMQGISSARLVECLDKHCTPETAAVLKPLLTAETQTLHTIVHEFAHPIGRTAESDAAIGSEGMHLLEEAKATLLGTIAEEWRDPSPEKRLTLVALTVARVIRFMVDTTRNNPTVAPYVRENLVAATTLFESRVMLLTEHGVAVDIEQAKSKAWFKSLRRFNQSVLDAYDAHGATTLHRLEGAYCDREWPPVANLIAWVNRK